MVGLDLSGLDGVADYFLICSGTSEPQVKAIAEAVEDQLRAAGAKPWHIEGREFRRWVLLDFVDVVVHVFHEKTREYYLLERLWGDARRVAWGLQRRGGRRGYPVVLQDAVRGLPGLGRIEDDHNPFVALDREIRVLVGVDLGRQILEVQNRLPVDAADDPADGE